MLRQTGHVAVNKDANVDVHEYKAAGVHLRLPDCYEYEFNGVGGSKSLDSIDYPIPGPLSETITSFPLLTTSGLKTPKMMKHQMGALKIVTPTRTVQSFYFQRRLVVDTALSLKAAYSFSSNESAILVEKFSLAEKQFSVFSRIGASEDGYGYNSSLDYSRFRAESLKVYCSSSILSQIAVRHTIRQGSIPGLTVNR